jgi:hypothetical protein
LPCIDTRNPSAIARLEIAAEQLQLHGVRP